MDETLSIKTCSHITDFAMVYLIETDHTYHNKDNNRDEVLIIGQEIISALIEVKWSVFQQLSQVKLLHDQVNVMKCAQEADLRQVIYLIQML